DATYLHTGAVHFQSFAHAVFHFALIAHRLHVDKVDNHQTTHVAQAQLTSDFIGSFQVGLQGCLFDVSAFGCAGGVDVDSHHGLGHINHNGAAGWQLHFTLEGSLNLAFNLIAVEQRDIVLIELHLAAVVGHDLLNECRGQVKGLL